MPIQEQDATRRLAFCQLVNDNDVSHYALSTLYFLLSRPASFHFASRYPFDIASLLRLALRAAGVSPHHYILNSRIVITLAVDGFGSFNEYFGGEALGSAAVIATSPQKVVI